MRNYEYSSIVYVGSKKPLICRDGNEQYAKSMDLRFITYDKLESFYIPTNLCIIIDISVGWTTIEDMDIIEKFIIYRRKLQNIYFRLVDQFEHQWYKDGDANVYVLMSKLAIDYNIRIIGTYEVDYYGLKVGLTLPYPYLIEDEHKINHSIRDTRSILLTGANIESIYPMRWKLYNLGSSHINTLSHPGYSGKHWSEGLIGSDYLSYLSKYTFMACTTCNEGYELLKYIECAEAGCIPIGECPPSLKDTKAGKCIIEIPNSVLKNSKKFDLWFNEIRKKTDYYSVSTEYRNAIKEIRSKELLKSKLLNYVNRS